MDKGSMPGEVEVGADDLAVLPYTSGTTGVPKGCMHTHFTVYSNTVGSYHWLSNTSSSVHLCTVPIFHVTGMIHPLNAALYAGGTIVMLTRWDRETAVQAIEKYKVTHWVNIATMVIDILSMPGIEKRDVSSILFIGGGGAPLPAAIGEKLDKLMGLKYVEGYGLTETISQTHFNPPDRPKMQCIGIPSFGVEAKIIDPDTGEELPPNKTGELLVSGPEVCKGYWNKPEEDATLFREINGERYLRTGDLCYMDDEGYFFVVDRVKRMINRAGFKVWPAAVENMLYKHPAIKEACVVRTPDPRVGEEVKAYVVLKTEYEGKATAEDIIEWSKKQMAAYEYPRIIEFVSELPKSASGKIMWKELEEKERTART